LGGNFRREYCREHLTTWRPTQKMRENRIANQWPEEPAGKQSETAMGLPAARVNDMVVCPAITVLVPHVGGPIAMGAPTVMIGGMMAARMGDLTTCVGPPGVVAAGSPTVLIAGMPAARMGDVAGHGGAIVGGCPNVLIG
jgi:uncharacterized Zn-binding protein involved in type VI secretion